MRVSKPTQQEATSTAEDVSICLKKYILRPYKERLKLFTILLREIIIVSWKSHASNLKQAAFDNKDVKFRH